MGCYFPEDLVVAILLRLPVNNCLVRFRLVSKSWCSRLSDPSFIYKLIFSDPDCDRSPQQFLLKFSSKFTRHRVYTFLSDDTLQISKLRDLPHSDDMIETPEIVLGCSNGLICIASYFRRSLDLLFWSPDLLLWNPATSETRFVRRSKLAGYFEAGYFQTWGFGFDPKTEDYKVVEICKKRGKGIDGFDNFVAQVYSLKNNSWKQLDVSPQTNSIGNDGGLNWWANDGDWNIPQYSVVSFDMTTEIFRKTLLPDFGMVRISLQSISFFPLKDSLAMIRTIRREDGKIRLIGNTQEIWILLEDGVKESWLKLYTLQLFLTNPSHKLRRQSPLQIRRNGQVFLVDEDGKLLLWDPPTQKITAFPIQIPDDQVGFEMVLYKESSTILSRKIKSVY